MSDNIVDYSEYFQGISGCAVIYDESSNTYSLYGKEKCEKEVSPLSTFKIVSDVEEDNIPVYPSYNSSWTEEEMIDAINERSQYYRASSYYSEIVDYWENVREVRDISNLIEPLFETDKKYYTKEEFENEPMLVIHLAQNEIYARHGYIFTNEDLYNYFMGCIWYSPTCDSADFDEPFTEWREDNTEAVESRDTVVASRV